MRDKNSRQAPKNSTVRSERPPHDAERPKNLVRRCGNIVLGLAVLFVFIHGVFGPHGVLATYRTRQEVRQVRHELEKLRQENERLTEKVKALKSDSATIEGIARDEMGLTRPGELVFKIPDKTDPPATSSQPATNNPAPQAGPAQPQPK